MEIKIKKTLNLVEDRIQTEEVNSEDLQEKEKEKERTKFSAMMSLASELGFSISLPLVGGAVLGQFLDNKFGTAPRLTLSLIVTGLMIGFANIYFIIRDSEKN